MSACLVRDLDPRLRGMSGILRHVFPVGLNKFQLSQAELGKEAHYSTRT